MELEAFQLLIKVCKEKQYNEFIEALHKSYLELIKVEAEARRKKASVLIKGMQTIDRELLFLNFEYDKVKRSFNIDGIPYFDQLVIELSEKRSELSSLKNSLK